MPVRVSVCVCMRVIMRARSPPVVPSAIPLFIGTAVYSMEGINTVLPIEASMRNKAHGPLVFFSGAMTYCVVVVSYGAFAYLSGSRCTRRARPRSPRVLAVCARRPLHV